MDARYYIRKIWYKIIYLVVVIGYLICLKRLNKELLEHHFNAFDLLAYRNYAAIKYFAVALILFVIGVILVAREYKRLKEVMEEPGDILMAICTIVVIVVLLLLIIVFIDNPILRAILTMVFIIGGGVSLLEN